MSLNRALETMLRHYGKPVRYQRQPTGYYHCAYHPVFRRRKFRSACGFCGRYGRKSISYISAPGHTPPAVGAEAFTAAGMFIWWNRAAPSRAAGH